MSTESSTLEPPLQKLVDRGKKTIEVVLTKAGARRADALHTTTNELSYLMGAVRLAIEALESRTASEKDLHEARLRGLARMAELRKAAEPVLETGEVCGLLGVSRETVRKKIERKQLLALPKGEDRVFPAFQFKDGEVIRGLPKVLQTLKTESVFVVLSFLLSRNADFGGRSALELLDRGEIEAVAAEARTFLGHGD